MDVGASMIISDLHSFDVECAPKQILECHLIKMHLGSWHTLVKICTCFDDRLNNGNTLLGGIQKNWGFKLRKEHFVTEQRRGDTMTDLDRRAQQGAGKRSLLDPDCFTVTLQWAMGCSPHNKTTAVPFCSDSHSTHMLLYMHFTADCSPQLHVESSLHICNRCI